MTNKIVKDTFTNFIFDKESYKPKRSKFKHPETGIPITVEPKIMTTNAYSFSKHTIELEALALSLLKIDLNRAADDISKEFTKKWGFLDFKKSYLENKGLIYPYVDRQTIYTKDDERKFIQDYWESTHLWKDLSIYLHYLFYLKDYSTHQINRFFINNPDLPDIIIDERDINFQLSNRVYPSLGYKDNKLTDITLETDSLFGAVLMYGIDNFYREIRQCKGPNCRQLFFVKRKGRMFCEPNGRCAKAFERMNKN